MIRRVGLVLREASLVLLLAAAMLAALLAIVVRTAPTLLGVTILLAISWWAMGPVLPEEALWRARLRHRFLQLERCPWLVRIDEDDHGTLYRTDVRWPWWDEQVALLEVCNHTPEPDGLFRLFVLRVPPDIQTARAAVAWTFRMDEDQYRPDDES